MKGTNHNITRAEREDSDKKIIIWWNIVMVFRIKKNDYLGEHCDIAPSKKTTHAHTFLNTNGR